MATSTSSRDGITGTHLNQIPKKKVSTQFFEEMESWESKNLASIFLREGWSRASLKKKKKRGFHELLKEIDRLMVFEGDK